MDVSQDKYAQTKGALVSEMKSYASVCVIKESQRNATTKNNLENGQLVSSLL